MCCQFISEIHLGDRHQYTYPLVTSTNAFNGQGGVSIEFSADPALHESAPSLEPSSLFPEVHIVIKVMLSN